MFQSFLLRNLTGERVAGVQVFVELHSNEGTYPYRQSFNIDGPVFDFNPSSASPSRPTSRARSTRCSARRSTSRITWGKHEIFSETFPVTMAPVDQWADTDMDRVFLPSFIFPRDRAVATVIKNAEHFVTTLRDDPTAGFDGYQSLDPELANPALYVDSQVQALWYSVVYKVPVSLHQPAADVCGRLAAHPHAERDRRRRLRHLHRSRSHARGLSRGGRDLPGDLPAQGPCVPGYWRTDAAREAFLEQVAELAPASNDDDGGQRDRWRTGQRHRGHAQARRGVVLRQGGAGGDQGARSIATSSSRSSR